MSISQVECKIVSLFFLSTSNLAGFTGMAAAKVIVEMFSLVEMRQWTSRGDRREIDT